MADSEQLRLDIGICVKGPEGSETIEVEPVSQPGCALPGSKTTLSMSAVQEVFLSCPASIE